jgi:hypothetical protein
MSALTVVYVIEDVAPFLWLYAALEDTQHAAFVELPVDDDEGLATPHDHP